MNIQVLSESFIAALGGGICGAAITLLVSMGFYVNSKWNYYIVSLVLAFVSGFYYYAHNI